nr:MAG TPA: hypothetical protein [Crassvirales sp.]
MVKLYNNQFNTYNMKIIRPLLLRYILPIFVARV